MSNNPKIPSGIFGTRSWISVVAIIVGYAFVQIVTSMNPDTAPYSFASLGILAFLAYVIIKNQHDNRVNLPALILRKYIELLDEFREDMIRKKNNVSNPNQKIYDQIISEVDIRITTFKRALKDTKETKTN